MQQQRPRLLYFHSPRSGRCRRTDGYLAQVLQHRHNHDTFHVTRVPVEAHPELVKRLRVETVPTFLVVDGRKVQARLAAPRGCHELQTFLSPWLSAPTLVPEAPVQEAQPA
jgi:thioredoxin-like negative regulator of GroEL